MIKTLCLFSLLTINLNESYSGKSRVKPLGVLVTDFIFRAEVWPKLKEELHQSLLKGTVVPEALKVVGKTFEGLDFSGVCWKGVSFRDCQFIDVSFEEADLREVDLEGALFKGNRKNLDQAILYCHLGDDGEPLLESAFRFDASLSELQLVRLYARLMRKSRRAEKNTLKNSEQSRELLQESRRCYEEAQGLNKLLGPLRLNLYRANLKHVKLDGICLRGANLRAAKLNGSKIKNADLSEINLQYGECERAHLKNVNFKHTRLNGSHFYQSTLEEINFQGTDIGATGFEKAHLKRVDFRGAKANGCFYETVLEDVDFENASLRTGGVGGSHLKRVNFEGADLYAMSLGKVYSSTDINVTSLSKVNLKKALFKDFKGSEKIYFPDYDHLSELFDLWDESRGRLKEDYHDYIKSRLKVFKGVPYEKLKRALSQEKNLINANLKKLDLHNIDFTNCNLSGAALDKSDLQNADLRGAKLTLTSFIDTNLEGIILSDTLTLPHECPDSKLIELFHASQDPKDFKNRRILKKILKGKKLFAQIRRSQLINPNP